MPVITRQELQSSGIWWTWINYEGFNTFIAETNYQMDETEAQTKADAYNSQHQYDTVHQERVEIYENRETIINAVKFIKTTNPTLTQWNNYLAFLSWDDAYMIRFFLAKLAQGLASRAEIDLTEYTEIQVLAQLKTFIINTPARRLAKIIFGEDFTL